MTIGIGWVELSPKALRALRAGLQDQQGDGVVDEVGTLALHSAYADRLFPGTSVLHTRARYFFIVPWVYLELARKHRATEDVRKKKDRLFFEVTGALLASEDTSGIIGKDLHRRGLSPAQPADSAYWSALRAFGFYDGADRSTLLARWQRHCVVRKDDLGPRGDDATEDSPANVFDVPPPPEGFPCELEIRLGEGRQGKARQEEANRLIEAFGRPGTSVLGTAARMLRAGPWRTAKIGKEPAWAAPIVMEAAEILGWSDLLVRAGDAAFLAQLMRATYTVHVASARRADGFCDDVEDACLATLRELVADDDVIERVGRFELRDDEVPLTPPVRALLLRVREAAQARGVRAIERGLRDESTGKLLASAERSRKRERARLHPITGPARRADFTQKTVTAEPLHYRWHRAAVLLRDIQDGLRP
jgi:hypothetical protein